MKIRELGITTLVVIVVLSTFFGYKIAPKPVKCDEYSEVCQPCKYLENWDRRTLQLEYTHCAILNDGKLDLLK